ncbi:uncharacterized protein LOC117180629 [Belonocnema kinseyi]|uniref:uncharacterized protein LOC117180629 n=1 Tax=Belonocnema kinseyi TaxID=2817044 RepID=UPI00143D29D3|nr:uncharacterized protein LOC117180629 [Belonocnema kinseyi]
MESVYKTVKTGFQHHSIINELKKPLKPTKTINMKCIAAIVLLALVAVTLAKSIEPVKAAFPSEPEAENSVAAARSKRGYVLGAYTAPVAYSAYTAPIASYSYPYGYSAYSAYPYYAGGYNAPYYLA